MMNTPGLEGSKLPTVLLRAQVQALLIGLRLDRGVCTRVTIDICSPDAGLHHLPLVPKYTLILKSLEMHSFAVYGRFTIRGLGTFSTSGKG